MAQIRAILAGKSGTVNTETTDNKVTSLSSSSTDTQYPSAKAVYDELQDIDGANVTVAMQEKITILNTDNPTPGDIVYFRDYPDISWHVDHVDGDYVYLGLYTITETTQFRPTSGKGYPGSTIASKCTDYLNNTIPNVADYLESVTVYGVTNKVFIPTYYQMSGDSSWGGDVSGPIFTYIANASSDVRKTIISNDWTQDPPNYGVWSSSQFASGTVCWFVTQNGTFSYTGSDAAYGFRPEVKVRYKRIITKNLNTALDDINTSISAVAEAIGNAIGGAY